MRKLLIGTASAAVLCALAGAAPAGAQELTFALVPKNMNNPFFDQARDGCMKAESEAGGKFKCEYIGPGEHGGGEEQVQVVLDLIAKGVDGIAVSPSNAAAMGKALEKAKEAEHPRADLGQRPARQGQGPAHRLCRHQELRHRRQPRQAGAGDQAAGRHDLHPVRRCRCGQPQRAHAGHPRHAGRCSERRGARRPPHRPERLDRGRRLPALHRRRLPALGAADGGHPGQVPGTRRLHPDRRLPAVHPAGLRQGGREAQGADRQRRARARRRRHPAGPDGAA